MGGSSLPVWVQVLQALAVPVIAGVGAWIALQQMYLARVKLQHDLFDRRYAVFQAVRRFLEEAVSQKSSQVKRSALLRSGRPMRRFCSMTGLPRTSERFASTRQRRKASIL